MASGAISSWSLVLRASALTQLALAIACGGPPVAVEEPRLDHATLFTQTSVGPLPGPLELKGHTITGLEIALADAVGALLSVGPYTCAAYESASYALYNDELRVVGRGDPRCGGGEPLDSVRVDFSSDFADRAGDGLYDDRWITLLVTFAPDDEPDREGDEPVEASGSVAFAFFVSAAEGGRPHFVRVVPPRDVPGWGRPVPFADGDAYPTAVASPPLMAHERLELTASEPLIHIGVEATPNDLGEGLVWTPSTAGDPPAPFTVFSTQTNRGLIPGQRYELLFVGERGLREGSTVAPTQAVGGGVIGPWLSEELLDSPLFEADARFAFDVWPVRIESPSGGPIGLTDIRGERTGVPDNESTLPIRFIVPENFSEAATYRLRVSAGAATLADVTEPWTAAPVELLEQAGMIWRVHPTALAPTIDASGLSRGEAVVSVELLGTGGERVGYDQRSVLFDFEAPTLAERLCRLDAPGSCLLIDDPEERDCTLRRVCLPPASQASAVELTLCGIQLEVPLEVVPGPSGSLWCAEAVDFAGGSPDGAGLTITALDEARNASPTRTVAHGDDVAQEIACQPPPPRILGRIPEVVGHAVDGFATPIVVRFTGASADGAPTLEVSRYVRGRWEAQNVPLGPTEHDWRARDRIRFTVAADGSAYFCVSSREGDETVRDDLMQPAEVLVARVSPKGEVSTWRSRRIARATGCGISSHPDLDEVVVLFNEATTSDLGTRPALARCRRTAEGIDCQLDASFTEATADRGLIGFEPDVLVMPGGLISAVGRGYIAADGRLHEHGIYYLKQASGGSSARLTHPFPEQLEATLELGPERFERSFSGAAYELRTGALQPHLFPVVGGRVAIVASVYRETIFVNYLTSDVTTSLSARTETRLEVAGVTLRPSGEAGAMWPLSLQHLAGGPPPLLWPDRAFDPETAPRAQVELPLIDVAYAGTWPHVAWQVLPYTPGEPGTVIARLDEESEPRRLRPERTADVVKFLPVSALYEASLQGGPGSGFALREGRRLVDAPLHNTGEDGPMPRHLALALHPLEVPEASLVYDTRHAGLDDLAHATARGNRELTLAGSTSCARHGISSVLVDAAQTNLQPAVPGDFGLVLASGSEWSTVRAPEAQHALYSDTGANMMCALTEASPDGDPERLTRILRRPVMESLVGLATNSWPEGQPAVLSSASFGNASGLAGGTLILTRSGATRAVTLPAGRLEDFARAINEAFGATEAHPAAAVHVIEGPTVRARLMLFAWDPTPTLLVAPTELSARLGFPRGWVWLPTRGRPLLDAAYGDPGDRFRSCGSDCISGANGTCHLPSDCLRTDRPFLSQLIEGIQLRLGRPPLHHATNVCVPRWQIGSSDDVCGPGGPPHRGGTPGSYPSFVRDAAVLEGGPSVCLAGEGPTVVAGGTSTDPVDIEICHSCGFDGRARRCQTDDDCGLERACEGLDCPPTFLCTHLTRDFMGVPAREGLCARPVTCVGGSSCVTREVNDGAQTIRILTGTLAVDPPNDFMPASAWTSRTGDVECTLTGCALCQGAPPPTLYSLGANRYCHEDADCPTNHRCLTPEVALADQPPVPLCILRPFLENGRVDEILTTIDRNAHVSGVDTVADQVVSAIGSLKERLGEELGALALPARIMSFTGTPGGDRVELLIDDLEIDLDGAEAQWVDTPSSAPGDYAPAVQELSFRVYIESPITLTGHIVAAFDFLTIGSRFNAELRVAAIDLRFRPYVDHGGRLRLRHERTYFRRNRTLEANAADDITSGDLALDLHAPEAELLMALAPALIWIINQGINVASVLDPRGGHTTISMGSLTLQPSQFTGELGNLDGLGNMLAPILENLVDQPLLGGFFFGLTQTTAYQPATVLRHVQATGGGLQLRYDGALTSAALFQLGLIADPTATICCGLHQPQPDCLETQSTATCLGLRPLGCREEICGTGVDEDGDGDTDETDDCLRERCGNGEDDDRDGEVDEGC